MRDSRIQQIVTHLAEAAYSAADAASDAVQTAGQAMGEKYDELRLNMEVTRLQTQQDKIFASIGHTMYLIQSGEFDAMQNSAEPLDAQQSIDRLLLLADQKQQEIDAAKDKLAELKGTSPCPGCGKPAAGEDDFCPRCGAKL